jgi:hypothetical protein
LRTNPRGRITLRKNGAVDDFKVLCTILYMSMSGDKPSYTLVLGGGAHLGAIQAGQLLALAENNVQINRIVGCSVGALNGSWISRGLNVENASALVDLWHEASTGDLFDKGWRRAIHVILQKSALSTNDKLKILAERACPEPLLENFPTPTEVVTCNLTSGKVEYHQSGEAVQLVIASCSMPGVFPPVEINGERHVDGGVLDVLPWRRSVGEPTIVLDCKAGRGWQEGGRDTALGVLIHSFALVRHHYAYLGIEDQKHLAVLPGPQSVVGDLRGASSLIEEARKMTTEYIKEGGLEKILPKREPQKEDLVKRGGFWRLRRNRVGEQ